MLIHILILIDGLKHSQNRGRTGNILLTEQILYLGNSAIGKPCRFELCE